jgi:hypothetical protein
MWMNQLKRSEAMSNDKTYNGWSTYETWLVNLWLTNDAALYEALLDDVVNADTLYDAKQVLMSWLDNEYDLFLEAAGAAHGGLFPDLLKGALSEVNWYEIAKNWRNEE